MPGYKNEQISSRIKEIVSEYINKETNGKSIISVTTVDMNPSGDHANVFITVMPESEEKPALDFLKRKRTEIRKVVMKKLPIARIPFLEILIDAGEKLSRRITQIEIEEKTKE